MIRIVNLFLLSLLTCDNVKSDNSKVPKIAHNLQFSDNQFAQLPKCCPVNTALHKTNKTFDCFSDNIELHNFQILSTNISINDNIKNFEDNCYNVDCIDYVNNETGWYLARIKNCEVLVIYEKFTYFPKCCPLDYDYDSNSHNCVSQLNNNANVFVNNGLIQVIRVGLSHCAAVDFAVTDFHGDFEISKFNNSKAVIIKNGTLIDYGNYCIDRNANTGKDMIRACVPYEEACVKLQRRCVKKCCPDGQILIGEDRSPSCRFNYTTPIDLSISSEFNTSDNELATIYAGNLEKYESTDKHLFYIDEIGFFHSLKAREWITESPKEAMYCVEGLLFLGYFSQRVFLTLPPDNPFLPVKFYVQGIILAFSCICLFITILCYLILPELQNVHGRSMLMFCTFMLLACLVLCFMQLTEGYKIPPWLCVSIGITIAFSFLASFAWMNVICFDMWMAFGTMKVMDIRNKQHNLKKFLYYNFYAWGIPTTICGLAFVVYITECLPPDFIPQLDFVKCYFKRPGHSHYYLTFFIVPEATMILINIIFFCKTSIYCYRVKNEIQQMTTAVGNNKELKKMRFQADKEKLIMLLKLFLVMGISWTSEALTSILPFQDTWTFRIVELIGDCINAAQGIIIFWIFICKKRVFKTMKTKLGIITSSRISELSAVFTSVPGTNGNTNN